MTATTAAPVVEITGPAQVLRRARGAARDRPDVGQGEVVCIIGASGSGKSTLLRCVNLLEQPTAGTIRVSAPTSPTRTWTSTASAPTSGWSSSSSTCSRTAACWRTAPSPSARCSSASEAEAEAVAR